MRRYSSEMAQRVEGFDWSKTSIGPVERWPLSWRHALDLILASGSPCAMGLGPELIYLYNDAFIALGGRARHPEALGRPVREVWREIWEPVLARRFAETLSTGRPTGEADLLMPLVRSDYLEETYLTFSFGALADDHGDPSGIFCTATENTGRVITGRQLDCLRRLASHCAVAESPAGRVSLRHRPSKGSGGMFPLQSSICSTVPVRASTASRPPGSAASPGVFRDWAAWIRWPTLGRSPRRCRAMRPSL